MASTDTPFGQLLRVMAWQSPNEPKWIEDKTIYGLDTETAGGGVYCASWAGPREGGVESSDSVWSVDRCLDFLTTSRFRSALNVFYNLDYDAQVLLRGLPEDCLGEIQLTGRTEYDGLDITYVPSKFLQIKDQHANQYRYFDIAQFFYTSLENAAEEWLDVGKLSDTVDVTKFGTDGDGKVNEYIRRNRTDIETYARRDAELARELWREFADVAEALDIPCGAPYSTGYLAEGAMDVRFGQTGKRKPGLGPKTAQKMAWEAYRGGRFEVYWRGAVGDAVQVDINSAYPDKMRQLHDPGSLRWRLKFEPSTEDLLEADYGFVRARIWTDPDRPMQPFAVKETDVTYPALDGQELTVDLDTLRFALAEGFVTDIEYQKAMFGYAGESAKSAWNWIEPLYEKRQQFKQEGRDQAQHVLKVVLNSLYGKTIQVTDKRRLEKGLTRDESKFYETPVPAMNLPLHLRETLRDRDLWEGHWCGRYWNPVVGATITARTRLQLLRTVVRQDWEDELILVATDSLLVRKNAWERNPLEVDPTTLGAWDKEYDARAFVVGCGVLELLDEDGNPVVTKTRGYSEGQGTYHSELGEQGLVETVRGGAEKIPVTHTRMQSLGETIWSGDSVKKVGTMQTFPRNLSAGLDQRRRWPRGADVTFRELLESPEHSRPLRPALAERRRVG